MENRFVTFTMGDKLEFILVGDKEKEDFHIIRKDNLLHIEYVGNSLAITFKVSNETKTIVTDFDKKSFNDLIEILG